MDILAAAYQILKNANGALHYREITRRILEQELWKTDSKTPEAIINLAISDDIKLFGDTSRFCCVGGGVFIANGIVLMPPVVAAPSSSPSPKPKSNSLIETAAFVLEYEASKQPMTSHEILEKALEYHLLSKINAAVETALSALIRAEIKKQKSWGEIPRFQEKSRDRFSLAQWKPDELTSQIKTHNRMIRYQLLEQLRKMPSDEFERIIGEILVAIGFQEIDVTSETDDGGIDIQGKICVSDTFQLSTIARIKRWRADVQASVVQELRQILKSNQQGLIITTGEFSSSAKEEAERPESIPVTLINGAKLVQLMINHRIGIQPNEFYLFNIPNRDNSDI